MLCIVSKCATLPQTNAESLWSLSVFGCSTLSGLHSLQNRYCSGQRGNRLLRLKHNQRFTARWKPSTLLWLNLTSIHSVFAIILKKTRISPSIQYILSSMPSIPFLFKSLFTDDWLSRVSFSISHCKTELKSNCQNVKILNKTSFKCLDHWQIWITTEIANQQWIMLK